MQSGPRGLCFFATVMMDYLIRFVQIHETFRKPETESLAEMAGIEVEWLSYSEDVREHREAKIG